MSSTLFSARKHIGWTDISISPLGLGLSRIGSYTAKIGREDAQRLLEVAWDLGINVFDTADIYGQGDSERLLGITFRKRRHEIVICTKVGYRLSAKGRIAAYVKPVLKPILARAIRRSDRLEASVMATRATALRQDFSAKYLHRAIDASLRRLQSDYIDLLQLHSPPLQGLAANEVQNALEAARRTGKIRAYGISSLSPSDAATWVRWPGIAAIQLRFGRAEQQAAADLVSEAKSRNVGLIAREVLSGADVLQSRSPTPKVPAGTAREPIAGTAVKAALCAPLGFEPVNFVVVGTTQIHHLREDADAIVGMFAC